MKLPALPASIPSPLGPIAIGHMTAKKAEKQGLCGQFNYKTRRITIAPDMDPGATWVTLWHEIVHAILFDAGIHGNTLSAEQEESVCDAVGTFLTSMMLNGSLKVTSLGTPKAP